MSRTGTLDNCREQKFHFPGGCSHGREVRTAGIAFFKMMLALAAGLLIVAGDVRSAAGPRKLVFAGVLCEHRLAVKDIEPSMPSDWTGYTHLVMEMRTSTPQRFGLWVYTTEGPRRIEMQPFGQNVWLRASVPLRYFKGMDQSGADLASTNNRRTNSYWMGIWGPYGDLTSVESIGFAMEYPNHTPTIELRNIHLSKQDEGSEFLNGAEVRDPWGQWAYVEYPRKIKSQEQLDKELAEEERAFGRGADFGYCELGGYKDTRANATGFFRVEQIDGVWWFIDPHGHLYLSTGVNGAGSGFGSGSAPVKQPANAAPSRTTRRLESWGFSTGGQGKPRTVMLRWNMNRNTLFLGLPDVYSADFAAGIDQSASQQCAPLRDDPLVLGYFIGNEPPWGGREGEVVDMILKGPDSATKMKLGDFLAQGDTPNRRRQFVVAAFERYLNLINTAIKKYDPNHLNLGIRFGGNPAADVMRLGRMFDVCSINVYEYAPIKQLERAWRYTGRPILIGEFHIGVPENGLGAGLVQAMNQTERGIGYRYYVEQGLSLPYALGTHWFQWTDEPITGRMDGENYNIGFIDATGRAYPELVEAAKTTHKRLHDVHAGKVPPFSQRPKASEVGAPSSPWDL
jgi:hypothetical protein